MSIVVTSGSLHGVMVVHWPGMSRDVRLIPALATMFSIFVAPTTLVILCDAAIAFLFYVDAILILVTRG